MGLVDLTTGTESAVSAFGVCKGVSSIDAVPGLEQTASALLRVLIQPGSRPLHDSIKSLLLAMPADVCASIVDSFLPDLVASTNHETVLTAGTLCGVKAGLGCVAGRFHDVIPTCIRAMNSIVESITFSQSQSMSAKLDRAVGREATQAEEHDDQSGEGITLADPQLLVHCLHATQEVLASCSQQVSDMIQHATMHVGEHLTIILACHVFAKKACCK